MMNEMFRSMASMHHEEATGPTECQDLLGMSFPTSTSTGSRACRSYLGWVTECDMDATYRYHRRVLQLLQWHCRRGCGTSSAVHMFAFGPLLAAYPTQILWSHRDPPRLLGSVCNLITTRERGPATATTPWSSAQSSWAVVRGHHAGDDFRSRVGDDRLADLAWADLQTDPSRARLGLRADRLGFPRAVSER